MRSRLASTLLAPAVLSLCMLGGARIASAQAALDDDDDAAPATTSSEEPAADDANKPKIGVGVRVRQVFIPKGLIELFVEHANGGSSETGVGLEVSRRKGNFEVQFGLEWDNIYIPAGLWVDKGDMIPQDEPDYVEFGSNGYFSWKTFGWLSAEVSFINHTEIIKQLSLRYGGGAGIAVVKGDVFRTDYRCATADLDTLPGHCADYGGPNQHNPYNIPPVMLIVNAIIGVQIRPIDRVFINVEGGLRTAPFFGATFGTYF